MLDGVVRLHDGLGDQGDLPTADEMLSGAATRYMDGGRSRSMDRAVRIVRASCTGIFTYHSQTDGQGRLQCDDLRSGPFTIDMQTMRGQGDLNGHAFSFALGGPKEAGH